MYEACGFVPDGLRVAEAQLRRSTTLGAAAENMTKLEATAFLRKVVESRQRVVSHRVKVALLHFRLLSSAAAEFVVVVVVVVFF